MPANGKTLPLSSFLLISPHLTRPSRGVGQPHALVKKSAPFELISQQSSLLATSIGVAPGQHEEPVSVHFRFLDLVTHSPSHGHNLLFAETAQTLLALVLHRRNCDGVF
jgi:hypothetical protein